MGVVLNKNRIYAAYENKVGEVEILKGNKKNKQFKGLNGTFAIVDASYQFARTYKGRPIFRLKEGEAEPLPWSNGEHKSIITADRYDETLGNNYVQQIMDRLNPKTLESVRNWIMFACVLGIIVFQFWLYNETQKDLNQIKLTLQQILISSKDQVVV